MRSEAISPLMKRLLDELGKGSGTKDELASRLRVHERSIRDAIRSLKSMGVDVPYVLKSRGKKVYYLKYKPVIFEEKKVSLSVINVKEILGKRSCTVYELTKLTGLSSDRIREILTNEGFPSVKKRSGLKVYYIGKAPAVYEPISETQRKIMISIREKPKTSSELAEELSVGFKAIRELIKKLPTKVYTYKIQNIRHYCMKDFDYKALELKNDVSKKKLLNIISTNPMPIIDLSRKLGITPKTVNEKIAQLKSMGYKVKCKGINNRKYYYVGKEPMSAEKKLVVRQSVDDELELAAKATYNIPESSPEEPFIIKTANKDFFKIGVANTVYGGVRTDKKLFKNFLRYCDKDGCDAIILNGNLIWMDLMTYSKNKPDRSRISSREIDASFIEYPEAVKKYRDPAKLVENGETVYITFKEKLDMILKNELAPLFKEEELLLFNKPIYILFGGMEDELRRQHTNLLNRIKNRKEVEFVNNHIARIRRQLEGNPDNEKELLQEMSDWEDYKNRIYMGNIDDASTQRISRAMQGYIIQKLESTIPNSKVISVGEGYVKANDTEIMVLYNAKKGDGISDHLINYAISKIQSNLASGNEQSPDIVITGGLSPYYACKPITYVTKKRGTRVTTIIQLPTCLEEEELRKLVRTSVSNKDVLTKLGNSNKLSTGAIIIENHQGINKRKLLTGEFLTNTKKVSEQDETFYELDISDEHVGSKFVSVIERPNDVLYFTEAYQQMLYEINAPISRINNLGDEIQGLNYDVWKEKHPDFMETNQLLLAMKKHPEQLIKITKLNSIRTGVLLPPDQVDLYVQIQNIEFLKGVLQRAEEIKLIGGVINFTEGNHSENTDGYQISSRDIKKELVNKLKSDRITAEIFGMTGMRESAFGINPNLYAEYNRHVSPGSKNKSYASLLLDRRLLRGRTFKEHEGKTLISRFGHLHTGLEAYGNNNLIISCYCGQERTDYGESRDYPLVTVGARIIGYPSGGVSTGPIIFIDLFKYNLKDYFEGETKKLDELFM
jgi:biotin operon repressor